MLRGKGVTVNGHCFCLSLVLKIILFSFPHQKQEMKEKVWEKTMHIYKNCMSHSHAVSMYWKRLEKLGEMWFLSSIMLENGDGIAAFIWWQQGRELLCSVSPHW